MLRIAAAAAAWLGLALAGAASAEPQAKVRLIVLTDIGNEPDDSESVVRLLLYADQFDIEGLIATTSLWQPGTVKPQLLHERIDAYGEVVANLRRHAGGFPDAEILRSSVRSGAAQYGMAGVGDGRETEASRHIIDVIDRADARPVHISIWGGAADLAQALWTVRRDRTPDDVRAFVARLRVYSISDQDDAGPWIRETFPDLAWTASFHPWKQFDQATWQGISGDIHHAEKWPGAAQVTNDWLAVHIRRGPLGRLYPPHKYIMEGDTPSFLGLIRNGLNEPGRIDWGGWGGRYQPQTDNTAHFGDASDQFTDDTGTTWSGNKATIFRWREAFQNDFAARLAWTLDEASTNHPPQPVLDAQPGLAPVYVAARSGETVTLSAEGSSDPDGDPLTYRWHPYGELAGPGAPPLILDSAGAARATLTAPRVAQPTTWHIILEVKDTGAPPLTTYRRAILTVTP